MAENDRKDTGDKADALAAVRERRGADFFVLAAGASVVVAAVALFGALSVTAAAVAIGLIALFTFGYFISTAGVAGEAIQEVKDEAGAAARNQRAESERAIRAAIIEALSEPALYIDPQGRVTAANAAARRQFRIPRLDLALSSVVRRPELLDAVELARAGAAQSFEFVERDETDTYFACVASPVANGGGVLVSMHDLTAIKRAEFARVDFLANASHELRTPLTSLSGFIETMQGPAKDDPAARERFLGIMQGQAERMRRLISDLLSLSRIELIEHTPPDTQADLAAVVAEVGDALQPVAKARNVKLRVSGPASAVFVTGVRDELSQVVQNLMDNAIKYSEADDVVEVEIMTGLSREEASTRAGRRREGAGRMSIVTSPAAAEAGERFVVLRVSDSGPGIERQHLPRLSERFYRVDQGRGLRPGTGLGLAIVKHVVARHRGEFLVESETGEGTSFGVVLPMWPEAAVESPIVQPAGRTA
jgi:two-component system phosphate regulon sensor histidine kinase PhoR